MACFVELKFKDNEIGTTGGEKTFLLPVIDSDVNLTVDDISKLIMESDNEELKSFVSTLRQKYDTKDAIMERGKISVASISSIQSNISATQFAPYIKDDTVKSMLDYCIKKMNIDKNIHIANAEIVNWDGKACDGVLFRQGSLKKIQIDTKTNVTSDTFASIVSDPKFQSVLGHELMHYIADEKLEELDVNSVEYRTIESIYNSFRENYSKVGNEVIGELNNIVNEIESYEGVRKLQEFLANAIGNNTLRNIMMQLKPIERTEDNKSLLDSFVGWLSKLVFGEKLQPSLMSDLLNVTSGLFDFNNEYTEKEIAKKNGEIVLNGEQSNVVKSAIDFINNGNPSEFFTIEGKAGTGKTTIAEKIVSEFPSKRVFVAALSHKAKNVIKDKFTNSGVNAKFYSLAGLLGQKLDLETGVFSRDEKNNTGIPIERADIILIDESSMVNEQALEMIFEFKKKNAKVIFLGDIGQLPPIRTTSNPYYRNRQELLDKKSPTFNTRNKGSLLTRVRQGEESPILPFADLFWENSQKETPNPNPASIEDRKNIITNKGALLFVDSFSKIKDSVLASFKKAIENNNPNHIKVVTYKNDTRKEINSFIHESVFGSNAPEFNKKELLIFNDSYLTSSDKEIENSTEIQVIDVKNNFIDKYGLNITTVNFIFDNSVVSVPVVSSSSKKKYNEIVSQKFSEAFKLKGGDRNSYLAALREAWDFKNKYANVDYAYAITSHKSQGSTYDIVVVDEKDINSVGPISNKTKSESIYTALTRSRNVSVIISSIKVENTDIDIDKLNDNINSNKSGEKLNPAEYTNHSGGAAGSDSSWDVIGSEFGMLNNRHYYYGKKTPKGNVEISNADLEEGWEHVLKANKTLHRKPDGYKNLLSRNWMQVKNSDTIFAIGTIDFDKSIVNGGTGWAIQMAVDENKPIYVYDQTQEKWFTWKRSTFVETETPTLTKNFAGIGTREINKSGEKAIRDVYEKTFNKPQQPTQTQQQSDKNKPIVKLIDENYPYTKNTAVENPDTNFIFTENAEAYVASTFYGRNYSDEFPNAYRPKLNVTATNNQAGIRTDDKGNVNKNAIGIVVKKYQQDRNGRFVKQEGTFSDNENDFNMFIDLNKHSINRLLSEKKPIVTPKQFAMGKAALPLRFAEWLKNELEEKLGIVTEVKENKTSGYDGYGLEVVEIKEQQEAQQQEKTINIYAGTGENSDLSNFAERPFDFRKGHEVVGSEAEYYFMLYHPFLPPEFQTVEHAFQAFKFAQALSTTKYGLEYITGDNVDETSSSYLHGKKIANILDEIISAPTAKEAKRIGNTKGILRTDEINSWNNMSFDVMKFLTTQSFKQNPDALNRLLSTGNTTLTHTQVKGKWVTEFPRILMMVRDELRKEGESTKTPTTSIDKTIKERIFKGGNTITIKDALENISNNSNNKIYSDLAKILLKKKLDYSKVITLDDNWLDLEQISGYPMSNVNGFYATGSGNIFINPNGKFRKGNAESTILHEILHYVTEFGIDRSSTRFKDLEKIFAEANKLGINKYGLQSVDEFISEIFVKGDIIRDLSKAKPVEGIISGNNLLEQFVNSILSYLGLNQGESLYTQASNVVLDLLTDKEVLFSQQQEKTPSEHLSETEINEGIRLYNEAEKLGDTNPLSLPFSKSMPIKSSSIDNITQLSYLSDILSEKYGIKMNLMDSRQIAKEFDTPDSTFSRHRAFIVNNEVYINTDKASIAEPLHEMGHIVLSALKYSDYDLYEVLLRSIQTHPSYNEIAKYYKELEGVNLDEEVFTTVFGEHYRGVVRSKNEGNWHVNNESLFTRIMDSIKSFFSNLFGVDIDMPAEDFARMPLNDVLTKFGDMLVTGRFADVNTGILMNKTLEGLKRKLLNEGLLTQMC